MTKGYVSDNIRKQMCIRDRSYSEQEAILLILRGLTGDEGLVIASSIAEEAKITRSVISNALRKLESAGLIQTRSLGMKGTYIKITNPYVMSEIEKMVK